MITLTTRSGGRIDRHCYCCAARTVVLLGALCMSLIAVLTGCGGGGGNDDPTGHVRVPGRERLRP
jgi:hypothetical protein